MSILKKFGVGFVCLSIFVCLIYLLRLPPSSVIEKMPYEMLIANKITTYAENENLEILNSEQSLKHLEIPGKVQAYKDENTYGLLHITYPDYPPDKRVDSDFDVGLVVTKGAANAIEDGKLMTCATLQLSDTVSYVAVFLSDEALQEKSAQVYLQYDNGGYQGNIMRLSPVICFADTHPENLKSGTMSAALWEDDNTSIYSETIHY